MTQFIPHNREAEESLLGAALIDPSIPTMVDITPEDFYINKHTWIWAAMLKIINDGGKPDIVTLVDVLDRKGQLDQIGGSAYIAEIMAHNVSTMYADEHARIIRDMSTRRGILILAQDMAKAAQNTGVEIDTKSSEFIDRLVETARVTGGAVHWNHYINELYDEIEERHNNPSDTWGIKTGFPTFDRVTGGLQPSESLLITGSPEVGKSMIAVQICEQMAETAPGAIYSLEMTGKAMLRRVVSAQSKIETRKIKTGSVSGDELVSINEAIECLEKLPVYLSDSAGWTTTALRADLSRLKVQHGVQWFMFDYLALASDRHMGAEHERLAAVSRRMKLVCRQLDLAGVIIHSMTKDGMNSAVPKLSSLRGEAGVTYDADLVCFLTKFTPITNDDGFLTEDQTENMRTLFFGKGRELDHYRSHIHFVKQSKYPQFGEYEVTARTDNNGFQNVYRG